MFLKECGLIKKDLKESNEDLYSKNYLNNIISSLKEDNENDIMPIEIAEQWAEKNKNSDGAKKLSITTETWRGDEIESGARDLDSVNNDIVEDELVTDVEEAFNLIRDKNILAYKYTHMNDGYWMNEFHPGTREEFENDIVRNIYVRPFNFTAEEIQHLDECLLKDEYVEKEENIEL